MSERIMQFPEEWLLDRCRKGDLEAFGQVYARYERQVFRYAYHVMGRPDEADSIKQETFLHAHRLMPSYRQEVRFQTWLLRVCSHRCRNHIWNGKRSRMATPAAKPGDEPSSKAAVVMHALQDMPLEYRELIVLSELEGFSGAEIAEILDCSTGDAQDRLTHARRQFSKAVASRMRADC